ncbi:putative MFS family arabinose efflux permease [Brevundimonas vesicularis]|uniref:MFS transporter n=1 Tax=Brevundimonas vesicularis TaxID=41276 RepID=UPI0018EDFCC3|nr:MFS transporter [Brevundimonas vesicularis]MDQ1193866.1 putative MFS family arabinose efflux permease [Brevundimonas vesicularis]
MAVDGIQARLATRFSFLAAGFGLASWAPLVPFAKSRLDVDDGTLGLLLLCLGVGSVLAMALTGMLNARFGSKPIIVVTGLVMAIALPFLAVASTPFTLGAALFVFGAGLGSLDVAMNIHAVEVEKASGRPLMSGFHALFSIGGFGGAASVTALLSMGLAPVACAIISAAVVAAAILLAWPRLMAFKPDEDGPLFAFPRGIVLVLAILAAVTFLTEGAILDWSALLLTGAGLVSLSQGGIGYIVFSLAMTAGRLVGDAVTVRIGDFRTVFWGGVVALVGFAILLLVKAPVIAIGGFVLIGLGASNIVPVLFRLAGSQKTMPSGLAVAAITTTGYAGILVGPAGVGAVAHVVGLPVAFWMLAGLMSLIPLFAHTVTKSSSGG